MPSWLQDYSATWIHCLAIAIQLCAAVIIGFAALQATVGSFLLFLRPGWPEPATEEVCLRLRRWLVVALEFQIAADILRSAIAPTWNEIGQLAAVIVLRTVLNFFRQKEIENAARPRSN